MHAVMLGKPSVAESVKLEGLKRDRALIRSVIQTVAAAYRDATW